MCIEFGSVRVDSVRRGAGGGPPWIKSPLRRFTPSWTSTRVTCDCLLPFVHPLLSQVFLRVFGEVSKGSDLKDSSGQTPSLLEHLGGPDPATKPIEFECLDTPLQASTTPFPTDSNRSGLG